MEVYIDPGDAHPPQTEGDSPIDILSSIAGNHNWHSLSPPCLSRTVALADEIESKASSSPLPEEAEEDPSVAAVAAVAATASRPEPPRPLEETPPRTPPQPPLQLTMDEIAAILRRPFDPAEGRYITQTMCEYVAPLKVYHWEARYESDRVKRHMLSGGGGGGQQQQQLSGMFAGAEGTRRLDVLVRHNIKRRWTRLGIWNPAWGLAGRGRGAPGGDDDDAWWRWRWTWQPEDTARGRRQLYRYASGLVSDALVMHQLRQEQRRLDNGHNDNDDDGGGGGGRHAPVMPRPRARRQTAAERARSFLVSRPWFVYRLETTLQEVRCRRLRPADRARLGWEPEGRVRRRWEARGDWEDGGPRRCPSCVSWKWRRESPSPEPEDLAPLGRARRGPLEVARDMGFTPSEVGELEAIDLEDAEDELVFPGQPADADALARAASRGWHAPPYEDAVNGFAQEEEAAVGFSQQEAPVGSFAREEALASNFAQEEGEASGRVSDWLHTIEDDGHVRSAGAVRGGDGGDGDLGSESENDENKDPDGENKPPRDRGAPVRPRGNALGPRRAAYPPPPPPRQQPDDALGFLMRRRPPPSPVSRSSTVVPAAGTKRRAEEPVPSQTASAAAAPPNKRRRGRPRRVAAVAQHPPSEDGNRRAEEEEKEEEKETARPKRGRGRPRKKDENGSAAVRSAAAAAGTKGKKGKKAPAAPRAPATATATAGDGGGGGRARAPDAPRRRPGRPRKQA